MSGKPTYEELEKRVNELEKIESERNQADQMRRESEEKKLSASHQQFLTVLNSLDAIVYIADIQTYEILFVNNYGQKIFSVEDIIGKKCWKIFQKDMNGPSPFCTNDKLITASGKPAGLFHNKLQNTINKKWYACCDQAIQWTDGRLVRMKIAIDITTGRQTEQAILENEMRFRNIIQDISEISVQGYDEERKVIFWNQASEKIYGYTEKEALGNKLEDLIIPISMKEEVKRLHNRWIEHKEKIPSGELVLINKFGNDMPVFSSHVMHEFQGKKEMFCLDIDMTLIKNSEKERQKLQTQLKQSQKMESIGNLAGGIAHDFNNILSSVIGYTELALGGAEKGTELEDDLQEVHRAGLRAKDLVKQIMTFARQSDEAVKPIQVNVIAKEVLKFIKSSIPSTIQINDKIISYSFIMGSPTQIHQVLMNLCTNAAHAMEEKGGILEVSVNDTTIDRIAIPGLKPGEYIVIKVTDTGMGISPQDIHAIFEPYFTTKAVGEGTGMGLAVAHGIVENYGGKIRVDSTVGNGTCFTIYLPITKKQKLHTNFEKEDSPLGTENILFVDDEAPIAKMGSKVLEQLGYSMTTRTSSVEALELFRSKPQAFDLVVTDMTMPNMTGDKLASELMKIRSDILVVLCTGYSKNISKESAADIGIKALVYKPVVKTDLAKTVRKVLDDANSFE